METFFCLITLILTVLGIIGFCRLIWMIKKEELDKKKVDNQDRGR